MESVKRLSPCFRKFRLTTVNSCLTVLILFFYFICVDTQRVTNVLLQQLVTLLGLSSSPVGGATPLLCVGLCGVMMVTGGVGWFAPKSTFFSDFTFCLVEPQEQRVTLQSKRDFIFQICNNNLFCIEIIHLRETQAILFYFSLDLFFKNKIKTKKK